MLAKNTLHFSHTLSTQHPLFFQILETALTKHNIKYGFIPCTKDIWARDYMPVRAADGSMVQFVYNPSYLRNKKWRHTISDTSPICREMGLAVTMSNILLDGGNVVMYQNKAIVTDMVFKENPAVPKETLTQEIKQLFALEQLIIIHRDKTDFTGHADGMVRFVDSNTVLVNDYSNVNPALHKKLHKVLGAANLEIISVPYAPHATDTDSAHGVYVNFLKVGNIVLLPIFGIAEDENAINIFETTFSDCTICPVDCKLLAPFGGLLNCISWEH